MRRSSHTPTLLPVWAWLALFLFAPLLIVLKIAWSEAADAVPPYAPLLTADTGLRLHASTAAFAQVLTDPLYRRALALSVTIAGLSTALCLAIGYPMALAIARAPARRQGLLLILVMLPFWTGFLMRLNAWIGLLQDGGWIVRTVAWLGAAPAPHLLYTQAAVYLGMVYTYLPFMVLPLYARLSKLDPTLLDAAADLGASPARVFLAVTLPLSLPGVWAGVLLVFVPALGEYVIPELLGGPQAQMLGRVLWEEFFANRDWPTASALAIVMLALLAMAALLGMGARYAMAATRRVRP
ncbi:MAG TPA: ABC transporter permease subunit [Acetobacteraceae bacterium]|nr:ABC transporter permease subunit [Acetobacteraceae bacterium]